MPSSAIPLLQQLIAISSVNPALEAGAPGEGAVLEFIENRCRERGFATARQHVFPGRDNLQVCLDAGCEETLMFEAHMDTVPAGAMAEAFAPRQHEGRLYGRGSCDTKGSLAAMLTALESLQGDTSRLACNVTLVCTVDEEHGAIGIATYAGLNKPPSAAVIGEPTEMKVVIAHKGVARFAVTTLGKAAHSSVPAQGDSAIYQMYEVLRFFREKYEPLLAQRSHPLCGHATAVVGTIRGGTQVNIVPERCEIEIDRRLLPGENARQAMDEFGDLLRIAVAGRGVHFTLSELLFDPPLDTSPTSSIVQCAQQVAAAQGLSPLLAGVPFGSDASKLGAIGVPCIVFGPGSIAHAHTNSEFVPLHEVDQACAFYRQLALEFGKPATGLAPTGTL